jgi:F0F1-type ATP synthase membrane subunit b/b'
VSDSDQTLQQLLEVEREAAAIVETAQKKADETVAEADRQMRLSYNDRYRDAVAALNKEREAALAKLQADYDDELDCYKKELDKQTLNTVAFNKMVRETFFTVHSAAQ